MEDKYLIEISRVNRKFFLNPDNQLTWKKENANGLWSKLIISRYGRATNII